MEYKYINEDGYPDDNDDRRYAVIRELDSGGFYHAVRKFDKVTWMINRIIAYCKLPENKFDVDIPKHICPQCGYRKNGI